MITSLVHTAHEVQPSRIVHTPPKRLRNKVDEHRGQVTAHPVGEMLTRIASPRIQVCHHQRGTAEDLAIEPIHLGSSSHKVSETVAESVYKIGHHPHVQ